MNLLSRLPIRFQLLLIVLIMALPVVGIIINTGIQDRKEAMSVAGKDTEKLAERLAYEQQCMVASAKQLMASLSHLPEIKQRNSAKATSILREIHKLNPDFTNIFIADQTGTVWATAVPVPPPFMVSDRRYFKNTLAKGQLSSGEYIVARAGNRPSFTLGYPIKDKYGDVTDVIGVGFLLEKYTKLLERSKLPKNASFILRDHKGIVLFRGVDAEKFIGSEADPAHFKEMQDGPDESTTIGASLSIGDQRIISTVKLRLYGEPSPYMYVRAGIPVDSALENANTQLLRNLIFFSWVFILAFLLSSFIGNRSIVSRIALLQKASNRLAKGDYQTKVADLVTGGELGMLAESFDSMANDLVRREKELKQSEDLFRSLVENADDVVFTLSTNGIFTYVSPKWKAAFGYELSETIGKPFVPFVHPDDVANCFTVLQKVFETGERQSEIEYRVLCKDGKYSWYSANGSLLIDSEKNEATFLGVGRDISERKQAEEDRQENLQFIETLLRNAPVGIRVFDGESGNCLLVNQVAADIAGGDITTMQSQNFRVLDSWQKCGLLKVAEAVLADECARMLETDMLTSFGRQVSVEYIASTFAVKDKPHLLVIGRDITEVKLLVDKNRKIEAQMLHVQKLESMGVLAGGIAHDFNNILLAILGNAELALMHLNPESPARNNLLKIDKAAQRAADLAQQMLAYSGRGRFVIEPLDVNALITEMNHILEVSISKKAVVRIFLAKNLPLFEGDATQIRQIIMNLVINASEAIGDDNGVITVNTGIMDCDQTFLSKIWLYDKMQEGTYVYFEITDTGCGMNQETLSKLFDPFFTTKFTGRGLGMAAVLGIVRGHHGAITVSSEPDKGTNFKVFLPAKQNISAISARNSAQTKLSMGTGTVLLVDDEETILTLGKDMLEKLGYNVLTAENGAVAVDVYKDHKEEIACVILDLTMPRLDGEQTFQELQRIDQHVQVIMSSGFDEQEVARKFDGKGLAGFIKKPYKLFELSRKLQQTIRFG